MSAAASPLTIPVTDVIGKKSCLLHADAKKVFSRIHRAFKKKQPVEVSFRGADMVTLSFMETAIGSLYKKYDEKEIRPLVKINDLDKSGKASLAYALQISKLYFTDPDHEAHMKKVVKEMRNESYC